MESDEAEPDLLETLEKRSALATLQRFCRRRFLRGKWYEVVTDLIEWNQLVRQLRQKRDEREAAVQVLQRNVRRSPATNVAMRVSTRAQAPELIRASSVITAGVRGHSVRADQRRVRERHEAMLAEALALSTMGAVAESLQQRLEAEEK